MDGGADKPTPPRLPQQSAERSAEQAAEPPALPQGPPPLPAVAPMGQAQPALPLRRPWPKRAWSWTVDAIFAIPGLLRRGLVGVEDLHQIFCLNL